MTDNLVQCPDCGGCGGITIRRNVTHDMAIDAGSMDWEGMPIDENVPCPRCGGTGQIEIDEV